MSKTLEELQAELDAELAASAKPATPAAAPSASRPSPPSPTAKPPPPSGGRPPKRRRGLLDFLLTCALLYGVYATTPIGAMAEAAVRTSLGQKNAPSFFATFRGRETEVQVIAPDAKTGLLASKTVPMSVAEAATSTGVDAELLITLLSSNGSCDSAGCTMKRPRYLDIILERDVGDVVPVMQVAQGLSKAAHALDSSPKGIGGELAVEALYAGPVPTKLAVEQARATGAPNPEDVEAHAEFFAPSIRRGALQSALSILALHRLRTLSWPAEGSWRISSEFGNRIHPVLGTKKFHNGTDLAVPTGTPLRAVQRGVVSRARRDSTCGNYVKINYGFGIESTYCHMSEIGIAQDTRVSREQNVGKSGATGRVTGPHLHYILRVNGDPVDAEMYGASPTRKKAVEGEDPLGKFEGTDIPGDTNAAEKPPEGVTTEKAKPKKTRPKKKPKPKKDGTAPKSPAPNVDAGVANDERPADAQDTDDRPEPTPAMAPPEGEETVDLEDVGTQHVDAAKPDAAKPDAAKPDDAKPDAAKPDAAKPDAAKPDAAKPDAAKPDAAKPNVVAPKESAPEAKETPTD